HNQCVECRVTNPTLAPSIAFATVHRMKVDVSRLATINLNIYTTQLFKLPAGGIALALGAQFRRETLSQEPDLLSLERDIIGQPAPFLGSFDFPVTSPDPFTNGGRTVFALYAESAI